MLKPLAGCRVLDLGIITAGAATSALLSDLGAEVIKIESPTYHDPFRAWASDEASLRTPEGSPPFFRSNNRNKVGISIDLKQPAGRSAFLRLLAGADVVVENFRRGVMERLGLGPEDLQVIKPDVIALSISSQGATGPDAPQVSYGSTLEAVGGQAYVTGYEDGPPVISGRDLNYPDQIVAIFATSMVLAAWLRRKRTGLGAIIDVSQRDLTSFMLGDLLAAGKAGSEPVLRKGNAEPAYPLQDCFRAADGEWIAVSVTHEQCATVAELVAAPDAGSRPLTAAARTWISQQSSENGIAAFRGIGVACSRVLDGKEILKGKGTLWDHAFISGADGVLLKGAPFAIDRDPLTINRDAPAPGADTRTVLEGMAGYSQTEIETLRNAGVFEAPN